MAEEAVPRRILGRRVQGPGARSIVRVGETDCFPAGHVGDRGSRTADGVAAMRLSIVAPVFNEEKNIPAFLARLTPILQSVTDEFEVIFCLDPSTDRTEQVVLEHREKDPRVKLLKFSR